MGNSLLLVEKNSSDVIHSVPDSDFPDCNNIYCENKLTEYELKKQVGKNKSKFKFCKTCRMNYSKAGGKELKWKCINPQCENLISSNKYDLRKVSCSDVCRWRFHHPLKDQKCKFCGKAMDTRHNRVLFHTKECSIQYNNLTRLLKNHEKRLDRYVKLKKDLIMRDSDYGV